MESSEKSINYPVLKGRQSISGIWLPVNWFSEQQRRRLIVKYWRDGSCAFRFPEGDLIRFAKPVTLSCGEIEGWPLIGLDNRLYSAPLTKEELKIVSVSDLNLVLGNSVKGLSFADANKLEPWTWLDISRYQWQETYSYSDEELTPLADLTDDPQDINAIFGDAIIKPSAAVIGFSQSLSKQQRAASGVKNGQSRSNNRFVGILLALFAAMIAVGLFKLNGARFLFHLITVLVLTFWVIKMFGLSDGSERKTIARKAANWERLLIIVLTGAVALVVILFYTGVLVPPLSVGLSFLIAFIAMLLAACLTLAIIRFVLFRNTESSADLNAREISKPNSNGKATQIKARAGKVLPQAWRNWLARLALVSKVSYLIGLRQGWHLNKVLKLFDQGNLDEALRNALPIDGKEESAGQSFGVPKPRNKLTLSDKCYGTSGIYIDSDIQDRLRQLYRQSFTQLDRQGRVEEALFVLVELLNALDEGLEYLEEHQRYAQAMELGIARDAPADTIVRLCCLAGDWQRAVIIARRDKAFAGAVLLLESTQPEISARLRLEWAIALAEQSEWLKAVEAVWPLAEHREKAIEWLAYAEQAGGKLAATALVKRTLLLPDTLIHYQDYINQLRYEPDRYAERLAIANEILKEAEKADQLNGMIKLLLNAIVGDYQQQPDRLSKYQLNELIKLSGDKPFSADLPDNALPTGSQKRLDQWEQTQYWQTPEVGIRAICDAVPLYNDCYLIALGDAGAIIIDCYGRQQAHFIAPCHHLILSDNRRQVLLLAGRDGFFRVSKIDLTINKVVHLGTLTFDHCAGRFDGIHWTIVNENRMQVLDITTSFKIVWQVDVSPNRICQFDSTVSREEILLQNDNGEFVHWLYTLPERRLTYIQHFTDAVFSPNSRCLLSLNDGIIFASYDEREKVIKLSDGLYFNNNIITPGLRDGELETMPMVCADGWLIIAPLSDDETERCIRFYRYRRSPEALLSGVINWPASASIAIRDVGDDWLIFDNEGRLFHINTETSRSYRISVG